jgi:hypothetical protein
MVICTCGLLLNPAKVPKLKVEEKFKMAAKNKNGVG